MIDNGTIRALPPFDIPSTSGGQFAMAETTRAWTMLWLAARGLGLSMATMNSPSSPPVRLTFRGGRGSFFADLTPNPRFYELAMGWPTEWTAPEGQVTGFAAWLRRSRGQFSSLLTNFQAE